MAAAAKAVKELLVERERSKLNIEELTNLIDGDKELTERRRKMGQSVNQWVYTKLLIEIHLAFTANCS